MSGYDKRDIRPLQGDVPESIFISPWAVFVHDHCPNRSWQQLSYLISLVVGDSGVSRALPDNG